MSTPEIERRAAGTVSANGRRLTGYAAVFNAPTNIGNFAEVIRPGAFSASLSEGRDVVALLDHKPDILLGRTRSGSLKLREDDKGLAFDLQLPDTQAARDLVSLAERGDIAGASFMFVAKDEHWAGNTRELRSVELHEISIVQAWPAYPQTEVSLRNRPSAPESRPLYLWLETCR